MAKSTSKTPRKKFDGPVIEMEVARATKQVAAKISSKTANADNTLKFLQDAITTAVQKYGAKSFRGTIVAYK